MPTDRSPYHAELLRRLDDLPISAHDRHQAKANALLAFGLVDAIAEIVDNLLALFAPARRQATRAS